MKIIKGIGVFVLGIYLFCCAGLYALQERILFNPSVLNQSMTFRFGDERWFEMEDGTRLHGLHHTTTKPKGVILYLHGNRGNARWCQRQAEMFDDFGYDVVLLDYRGYGKSEGSILSQRQLYDDVDAVYQELIKEYGEDNMVIVGYSLGSSMASYLAHQYEVKHLILVAPFDSITDMKDRTFPLVPDFLVKYPLDNTKHLKTVRRPITIFHGTEDTLIPFECSVELKEVNPDYVQLITVDGASHRSVIFSRLIYDTLVGRL